MASVIVVLKSEELRDDFIEALSWTGLLWNDYEALRRHFCVMGTTVDDFPLKDHPAIESIVSGETRIGPALAQSVTVDPGFTGGNWGLIRHTRRDPPWPKDAAKLPITADFECARTGYGVDWYIVDTGVSPTHPEVAGRVENLYDGVNNPTGGAGDIYGHGTACASLACGNTIGFAREAQIFAARGLDGLDGTGATTTIINALNVVLTHFKDRAGLNRPGVLSLSLGGYGSNQYGAALTDCMAAGLIVCAAAGNDKLALASVVFEPAEVAGVITVGGINFADGPYDTGTFGTNYGTEVDILAASQSIYVASHTGGYKTGHGTSYGTPQVAGGICCMLQGYNRPSSLAHVQEVQKYIYDQATFGRYKAQKNMLPMTPAIFYLDPGTSPPAIPGLTKFVVTNRGLVVSGAFVEVARIVPPQPLRVTAAFIEVARSL
jgi:hypothetical protein